MFIFLWCFSVVNLGSICAPCPARSQALSKVVPHEHKELCCQTQNLMDLNHCLVSSYLHILLYWDKFIKISPHLLMHLKDTICLFKKCVTTNRNLYLTLNLIFQSLVLVSCEQNLMILTPFVESLIVSCYRISIILRMCQLHYSKSV